MRASVYEQLDRERKRAQHRHLEESRARAELAGRVMDLAFLKLKLALRYKFDPNQPRVQPATPTAGKGQMQGGTAPAAVLSSTRGSELVRGAL